MKALSQSSHIELYAEALQQNVAFVKSLAGSARISAVVKGNAYGHGISQFVPMAIDCGIDHFSVYGVEEAMAFHEMAHGKAELMIMGYIDSENLPWAIQSGYSFFVYDLFQLEKAIHQAKLCGIPAKIHLEVETGMNRTGLDEWYFEAALQLLRVHRSHLELCGICTHLAGAESIANQPRIESQLTRFDAHVEWFRRHGITFERRHAACSAGLIRFAQSHYDLVRIGILLYGFWPNRETMVEYLTSKGLREDPIRSVLTWRSKVMTIKNVKPGEYIGYGSSFLANIPMRIAVVPVGYAYGYARSLSNQGRVLVRGKRVAVVGTVNMNMLAIDITEVPGVIHGDEVVLIGAQGSAKITVSSFGEMSSQLNYELLARLPHNIPRIINQHGICRARQEKVAG